MWKVCAFVLVAAVWALGFGCEDESSCEEGTRGCSCRADGSCDSGLVCGSDGKCWQPAAGPTGGSAGQEPPPPVGGVGGQAPPPTNGLPEICAPVVGDWDAVCEMWEEELVQLINARRAEGAECGSKGSLAPAAALTVNPSLRCAARLNAKQIVEMGDLEAQSAQKGPALGRAQAAGYTDIKVGENVATNYSPPSRVLDTWMGLDSSCANIMDEGYRDIGAGCFQNPGADITTLYLAWTVQLGGPAPPPEW